MNKKDKIINAVAPIRICDIGGWTDTWFAKYGNIFNIAVYPYVEVQIKISEQKTDKRITINLENFGDRYSLNPNNISYNKHPLIEAAIDVMEIPENLAFDITIFSTAPPGASTGTSAAVSVAVIGALDTLTAGKLSPHEIAALAHSLETEKLGLQCGIQDQICSAYGGINYIQMPQFPNSSVSQIQVSNSIWWDLEKRLALIYIGSPHSSSVVHQKVIDDLGENAENDIRLNKMRILASAAKNAMYGGDFNSLGKIMSQNTEAQRELHRDLVCDKFEEIISVAQDFDAIGYKVNGAGGDGGSLTILTDGDSAKKRRLLKTLQEKNYQSLNVYLSRFGLRIWQ